MVEQNGTDWMVVEILFHWKFWKPINVIGGKVYFGHYHRCRSESENREIIQTPMQTMIKKSMGVML